MALTVRPDDEVYQFDTVWLGPDEYTLPIQARYVAWGTWLACFLVAAVVLIPIGGDGPAGVLGSLIWSLALSVVLSRAVMLVVDHERPLRSLPALFSAEARAALQARRRAERALLVRPGKIRIRETPPKVVAMRERQRSRAAARAGRKRAPAGAGTPAVDTPPVEHVQDWHPEQPATDDWSEHQEPALAWSIPTDAADDLDEPSRRVPVTYVEAYPATANDVPDLAPGGADPDRPGRVQPVGALVPAPAERRQQPTVSVAAAVVQVTSAGADRPADAPEPRSPRTEPTPGDKTGDHRRGAVPVDGQAALEARILLPARKDR